MTTLLVGFDLAWTANNSGALVGVLYEGAGKLRTLGLPQIADYRRAERIILDWQKVLGPSKTIIMVDQPTIVENAGGQRPVENVISSAVGLRYGGVQPANRSKTEMFGLGAPIWNFL